MAEITHLPDEIIVAILENKCISIIDIINFESVCQRFQNITLSDRFWEKKFYQGYSTARENYYKKKLGKIVDRSKLEEQLQEGIKCLKDLYYYVSQISSNNLSKADKKVLENLLLFIVKNPVTYHFILNELSRIINIPWPLDYYNYITVKYNFELIFNCLVQYHFIYKETEFINKPKEKRLKERQITIVAQYFLPYLSYSVIKTWLDDIVEDILLHLQIEHPSHPIFSTSSEQFLFWKTNNIHWDYWSKTNSRQIMKTLEKYIFSYLGINKLFRLLSLIISDFDARYKNFVRNFTLC